MNVLIYGKGLWHTWEDALGSSSTLWNNFPFVEKVISSESADSTTHIDMIEKNETVIIPLSVHDILNCPKGFLSLIPSKRILTCFARKDYFYSFIESHQLQDYLPAKVDIGAKDKSYPFILKRVDLSSGIGVSKIRDEQILSEVLLDSIFMGQELLAQEYIIGDIEYVTHVICRNGEVVWSATLEGPVPHETGINKGAFAEEISELDSNIFQVFCKIFKLSNFSGPACINFRVLDGTPKIFEINPRFGGSLMLPKFRAQLIESIQALLTNAHLQSDN